jgi:precorrin-2 dehydrogenase/sirohydrochlorin ferrochelatase/precorrin-6A/cobalt-precorrin-6A reductase
MFKILVFAGTTEGRILVENLSNNGFFVHVCVATDYAKDILEDDLINISEVSKEKIKIYTGRLTVLKMQELMLNEGCDVVVDATHPYATEVTENIKAACENADKKYIRLLRGKSEHLSEADCDFVATAEEAAELLNKLDGNILLTIGSKELSKYTNVKGFADRLYARVLPMENVIRTCNELGFTGKNLICMQGPFSYEMNKAMLKQFNCKYMVTKDSGKEGGVPEKYRAAKDAGAGLIVIGRAYKEEGLSLAAVLKYIAELLNKGTFIVGEMTKDDNLPIKRDDGKEASGTNYIDWFPMFANIKGVNVLVVGAGQIAKRRINTLLKFSCNLKVIADKVSEEVLNLANQIDTTQMEQTKKFEFILKTFEENDMKGAQIVIAATNDRDLNKTIGQLCGQRGILVNVADAKDECDFYFPGVVVQDELIVGITAGGQNHALAKKAGAAIRQCVKEL